MPKYLVAAGLASSGRLPSGLLFALVPLLVLIVALDAYCLIDHLSHYLPAFAVTAAVSAAALAVAAQRLRLREI
jgi:hypothetical protein